MISYVRTILIEYYTEQNKTDSLSDDNYIL